MNLPVISNSKLLLCLSINFYLSIKLIFICQLILLFLIRQTSPEKRLYVTKNFGETFSSVQDYVKSFFLRYLANETELYVQRLEPSTSNSEDKTRTTVLSSTNFFEKQVLFRIELIHLKFELFDPLFPLCR